MRNTNYGKRYTVTLSDGEKITASAGTLNELSCMLFEASEHYKLLGCDALARLAERQLNCIHEHLKTHHYYDDDE